jgi:hypothetical protein
MHKQSDQKHTMLGANIACPKCTMINEPDEVFCTQCGSLLPTKVEPEKDDSPTLNVNEMSFCDTDPPWGTNYFHADAKLCLWPDGQSNIVQVRFISSVVTLGRATDTRSLEHIDLSHVGAKNLGVSRKHVQIQKCPNNTLQVSDLGSANGTFLNGVRLEPNRPYLLRNRSELQLGALVMRVLFT